MAFFLVDIQLREKAKHMLTSREIHFCLVFALFAILSYAAMSSVSTFQKYDILPSSSMQYGSHGPIAEDIICNPKFPKTCQ